MRCCDVDPIIVRSYLKLVDDDTPDTPTQAYTVLVFQCRNPKCPNFGKQWEEERPTQIG